MCPQDTKTVPMTDSAAVMFSSWSCIVVELESRKFKESVVDFRLMMTNGHLEETGVNQ